MYKMKVDKNPLELIRSESFENDMKHNSIKKMEPISSKERKDRHHGFRAGCADGWWTIF